MLHQKHMNLIDTYFYGKIELSEKALGEQKHYNLNNAHFEKKKPKPKKTYHFYIL